MCVCESHFLFWNWEIHFIMVMSGPSTITSIFKMSNQRNYLISTFHHRSRLFRYLCGILRAEVTNNRVRKKWENTVVGKSLKKMVLHTTYGDCYGRKLQWKLQPKLWTHNPQPPLKFGSKPAPGIYARNYTFHARSKENIFCLHYYQSGTTRGIGSHRTCSHFFGS